MNSNWKTQSTDDLLKLYDYYIRKFAPEVPGVVVDNVAPTSGASLIVVDMQNDFILPGTTPGKEKKGANGKGMNGRFSVTSGLSVVEPLTRFMEANGSKFKKIIFTRDAHPIKHCSFDSNPKKGSYPPHCVINHEGAALHPSFVKFAELPNAEVVFKGVYPDADSYGGVEYPDDSYRQQRQDDSGGATRDTCCKGALCMDGDNDKTGGRYLKDHDTNRMQGFEDYPFTGVPQYTDDNLYVEGVCPDATLEKIKDQLHPKPFAAEDLLGGQTEGTHTIFVVGLAGDYCVKDTAINLAKKIKSNGGMLGGVKTNVVVIEPFTRYPTLPVGVMAWKSRNAYKSIPGEGEPAKNINAYLLKPTGNGKLRRLTKNEAMAADLEKNAFGHSGFINPIRPILKDYADAGVTLLMNVPEVSASKTNSGNMGSEGMGSKAPNANANEMEGGRRKNKTRKMNKKSCWPKRSGGGKRRGTRKPAGHKKGRKCVVCRR